MDDSVVGWIMMHGNIALFRADMVVRPLRTAPLKHAREQREKGEFLATDLKAIEDREITKSIRRQEEIGLESVTDNEFRRAFWHDDFLKHLDRWHGCGSGACLDRTGRRHGAAQSQIVAGCVGGGTWSR